MAGILCSGNVYFDRQDSDGVSTGLVSVGNATSFQITEASTLKERTSKMVATYGQVLDSVAIKTPAKIAITLDELNKPNLALVCLGNDATTTRASETAQTKLFDKDDVEVGIYYEIGDTGLTFTSVKDASNADFTHYVADAAGGLIQ